MRRLDAVKSQILATTRRSRRWSESKSAICALKGRLELGRNQPRGRLSFTDFSWSHFSSICSPKPIQHENFDPVQHSCCCQCYDRMRAMDSQLKSTMFAMFDECNLVRSTRLLVLEHLWDGVNELSAHCQPHRKCSRNAKLNFSRQIHMDCLRSISRRRIMALTRVTSCHSQDIWRRLEISASISCSLILVSEWQNRYFKREVYKILHRWSSWWCRPQWHDFTKWSDLVGSQREWAC